MSKLNLIKSTLALALAGAALLGNNAMAEQCDGEMVERSLLLNVDKEYRLTNASLTVCEVERPLLAQLKGFVAALNNNDAAGSRQFFNPTHGATDFAKLRAGYAPVYQHKDRLVVDTAYQVGDKVMLFFGMDTDPKYTNYFTFIRENNRWRYASQTEQRSGIGFMLAKAVKLKGAKSKTDLSLTLAPSNSKHPPEATLHINGSRCVDACFDTPEGQLLTQLKVLAEEGKFKQLPGYFAPQSRKKLSQWLDPIPDADKARVLEQHFFVKHPIYRYDFGSFSLLGYVKTDGELERFNKGLTTDVNPQHIYFDKQGPKQHKALKVANFYQETLIDDYLKQQLMLPFVEAR